MQRAAADLWAAGSFWHAGGLAWRAADVRADASHITLLGSGTEIAGWGWVQQGRHLDALIAAEDEEGADALSRWFIDSAGPGPLTADVASGARALAAALARVGFVPAPEAAFAVDLRCRATEVAAPPTLSGGLVVRALADGEQEAVVRCHRAAWDPHLLPWPPTRQPDLPSGATSSFSRAALDLLEATWPYRRELVTVVEAPDGSLVGSCIAWLDDRIGVAEIEPLGVVPDYRGRGIGRALCAGAAAAVAAAGGREVTLHARGDAGYPAARRLYESCGFRTVARTVPHVRSSRGRSRWAPPS